jgi:hypothetical protein
VGGTASATSSDRPEAAQIHISSLVFSDETRIALSRDTILVLTGPNNVGKSATLREIRDFLHENRAVGPVLKAVELTLSGTAGSFFARIKLSAMPSKMDNHVKIEMFDYDMSRVEKEFSTVSSRVMTFFCTHLGAIERLTLTFRDRRGDYISGSPKTSLQWLELDEVAEEKISGIVERTFGMELALTQ